jgi:acyl-CoA synthetase (AMP-forming)/AMP-acid ligase II
MLGLVQDWPLTIHKIIDFAAIQHPNREVVSRLVEGPIHRPTYRELRGRAMRVAQVLAKDGIQLGDRVATLAWNGHAISNPGTASPGSARSIIRSTRAFPRSKSSGS